MKNISINISKSTILNSVSLNSEYTGAKSTDPGKEYDRVATVKEDEMLLTGFWLEICGLISEKFKDLITKYEISDTMLNMKMELSNAFDDALHASIVTDITNAIVAGVTGRWFKVTAPEKSEEWLDNSNSLLNQAAAKLYHRKKPIRRS